MDICEICRSRLYSDEILFICPHCQNDFHLNHMRIWLKKNSQCPICSNPLDAKDLNKLPEFFDFGLDYDQQLTYGEATRKIEELEAKYDFGKGEPIYFQSKEYEPVQIIQNNEHLRILHYDLQDALQYLLSIRWYYFSALFLYCLYYSVEASLNKDLLRSGLFFICVLVLAYFSLSQSDTIFSRFLDRMYRQNPSTHIIIGPTVETHLRSEYLKTINLSDVESVKIFIIGNRKQKRYPGFQLITGNKIIFGDKYLVMPDIELERFVLQISEFINKEFSEEVVNLNNSRVIKSKGNARDISNFYFNPRIEWINLSYVIITPIFLSLFLTVISLNYFVSVFYFIVTIQLLVGSFGVIDIIRGIITKESAEHFD